MIQVTDEMVEAAQQATRLAGFGIMPHSEVRAALESALAVREKNSDGLTDDQIAYCHELADNRRAEWRNDLVARLRRKMPALGIVDSGVPNTLMDQAADLIERQAEEIAVQQDKIANRERLYAEAYKVIGTLTAERADLQHDIERHLQHISGYETERAELIEALRPIAVDLGDPNWDDMGLAELELTVGDCRRACALLERLGAKEEV